MRACVRVCVVRGNEKRISAARAINTESFEREGGRGAGEANKGNDKKRAYDGNHGCTNIIARCPLVGCGVAID